MSTRSSVFQARMRTSGALVLFFALMLAGTARADEDRDLEVTLELGALDRMTTPRPYASTFVPSVGVRAIAFERAKTRLGSYAHGPSLGFTYAAGPTFGTSIAEYHREYFVDAGYVLSLPLFENLWQPLWISIDVGLSLEAMESAYSNEDRLPSDARTSRASDAAIRRHIAIGPRISGALEYLTDIDLRSGCHDFIVVGLNMGLRNVHTLGAQSVAIDFFQATVGAGIILEL